MLNTEGLKGEGLQQIDTRTGTRGEDSESEMKPFQHPRGPGPELAPPTPGFLIRGSSGWQSSTPGHLPEAGNEDGAGSLVALRRGEGTRGQTFISKLEGHVSWKPDSALGRGAGGAAPTPSLALGRPCTSGGGGGAGEAGGGAGGRGGGAQAPPPELPAWGPKVVLLMEPCVSAMRGRKRSLSLLSLSPLSCALMTLKSLLFLLSQFGFHGNRSGSVISLLR